jgi:2-iminobutanoate/2-iminopropanoate deaminase
MSKPVGPYSPFREAGSTVLFSGQIGQVDGVVVDGGLEAELDQTIANLEAVLSDAGVSKDDVVKATVFLTDMNNYAAMNEKYLAFFDGVRPARSAVAVRELPLGAQVEIELIGHKS